MVMDDQDNMPHPSLPPATGGPRPAARQPWLRTVGMTLAVVVLGGVGLFLYRWLRPPEYAQSAPVEGAPNPVRVIPLFQPWPKDRKPDVVFLLTGEQHGYNKPCGCSSPQYGGISRRWNFIQAEIKARGWPIVALDVGDVAQRNGPQAKLKYQYSMRALKKLGYYALGIGLNEFGLPLQDALALFYLNEGNPPWALAANLHDISGNNDKYFGCVQPFKVNTETSVKIGVVGIVGPSIAKEVREFRDPTATFDDTVKVLPGILKAMAEKDKPEILVLLYQGTLKEAQELAKAYPEFSVIVSLSKEEEPREDPVKQGQTLIINVGWKGRKVGVLGAYRGDKGKPIEFHYQLASIGPEYETPEGKDKDNPMLGLLEDYSREVKTQNFLAQHARTKHAIQLTPGYETSTFVGSEKCKKCHEASYNVWKNSPQPHSRAYQTLVDAKRPSLQQYDPECVVCHVTGLNYAGGFRNEKDTPHLKDNGCENCHGPASMHIKNKDDKVLHALMNPYKTMPNETPAQEQRRINRLDQSCQKCHDIDNDVHWDIKKWAKIIHKEPK